METTTDDSGWNCSIHPSVFFLLGTLVLTTCATGMLCGSIMTDHWEELTWDRIALESLANGTIKLNWLLDGLVARINNIDERKSTSAFLVPMHGGIWTLCVTLEGKLFIFDQDCHNLGKFVDEIKFKWFKCSKCFIIIALVRKISVKFDKFKRF